MSISSNGGPVRLIAALGAFAFAAACADEAGSGDTAPSGGAWIMQTGGDPNRFFDCLDQAGRTLVSAHRGGPAPGYPENAIETFERTLKTTPALIEIDVATSADGVLFLMHDDTLDRTTTGAGTANGAPFSEIATLNLVDEDGRRTDFHPPSFADALAFLKDRTIVQIDFKRSTRFEDVVAEVESQGAENQVIYIAYSLAAARKLHRLAPQSMISLSITDEEELDQAIAAGVPADRLLAFTGIEAPNPRLAAEMDRRGVEVIFGTLGGRNSIDNEIIRDGAPETYAEIGAMNVDIIATDRPVSAAAALQKAGRGVTAGSCGVLR